MAERTAWMVGSTGLIGVEVLALLLRDPAYAQVVSFVRRPSGQTHPKLQERVVDFDKLDAAFVAGGCTDALCCLGTTMKAAGSQAAFRRVDHDYPLAFGQAAKAAGAKRFAIVTALGADARSLFFYNRVKGEVEAALEALHFASLSIARPSLLLGDRKEPRWIERALTPVSKLLPSRYRGIEASTVARALLRLLQEEHAGARVIESDALQHLGAA